VSIRLKILLGCLAMLCVTVGLGLYERRQARILGDVAIRVYEQSLLGISHARSAQVGFIRLSMNGPVSGGATSNALKIVIEDLDVVIDRTGAAETRAVVITLRDRLTAIMAQGTAGKAWDASTVAEMDPEFESVVELLTADAFTQRSDVDAMIAHTEQSIQIALGLSVALALLITVLLGASIIRPVRRAVAIAGAIAEGRYDNVINVRGRNETAKLLQALSHMQTAIVDGIAMREAQAAKDDRQKEFQAQLTGALRDMANAVETEATSALNEIGERTQSMASNANDMRESALRTNASSRDAAEAANRALATTQTVASATEQLGVSIREITTQVAHSTDVVGRAVAAGQATRERIDTLNATVTRIGTVADIISGIADHTNLLALNATIEAARAGDAGKGFAVVAAEVKQLAVQTARSTAEILSYIGDVRAATSAAIEAVAQIEQTVSEVNAISGSIAAAVEEQGAATAEIARSVGETAQVADVINTQIEAVSAEAKATGQRAIDVGDNATGLAAAIVDLKTVLVRVVRTSSIEVDRRNARRFPVDIPCQLATDRSRGVAGRIADISESGARIVGVAGLSVGHSATLTSDRIGMSLPGTIVGTNGDAASMAFNLDETGAASWSRMLDGLVAKHAA